MFEGRVVAEFKTFQVVQMSTPNIGSIQHPMGRAAAACRRVRPPRARRAAWRPPARPLPASPPPDLVLHVKQHTVKVSGGLGRGRGVSYF